MHAKVRRDLCRRGCGLKGGEGRKEREGRREYSGKGAGGIRRTGLSKPLHLSISSQHNTIQEYSLSEDTQL